MKVTSRLLLASTLAIFANDISRRFAWCKTGICPILIFRCMTELSAIFFGFFSAFPKHKELLDGDILGGWFSIRVYVFVTLFELRAQLAGYKFVRIENLYHSTILSRIPKCRLLPRSLDRATLLKRFHFIFSFFSPRISFPLTPFRDRTRDL